MAQTITTTWTPSGSSKSNAAARTFKPTAPAITVSGGTFRTITQITRTDGAYGSCGPMGVCSQRINHTDSLIDTSTGEVIAKSDTVNVTIHGTGPQASDRAKCTINLTREQSVKAVKAWNAGTLQIKRTLSVTYRSNPDDAKNPTFRSGQYDDVITVTGTNAAYDPAITLSNFKVAAENTLYANSGSAAPFTFSLSTSVSASSYWEASTISKRLELNIENLSGGSAPVSGLPLALTQNGATATTWSLTQANFTFTRANGGFSRGNRYRVTFTLKVGKDASNLTESASASTEIEVAAVPMHFNRFGNGIGIGCYSSVTNKDADGVLDLAWKMRYPSGSTPLLYLGTVTVDAPQGPSGAAGTDYNPTVKFTPPKGANFFLCSGTGSYNAIVRAAQVGSLAADGTRELKIYAARYVSGGHTMNLPVTVHCFEIIGYVEPAASDPGLPEGPEIMDEIAYPDAGIARADYVAMMSGIEIPADVEAAGGVQADAAGTEPPGIEGEAPNSAKFATVELYYDAKVWNAQMVRNAAGKWITEAEAEKILATQEGGPNGAD